MHMARMLSLWRGVTWRASDAEEAAHIRQATGPDAAIAMAPVIVPAADPHPAAHDKRAGFARLAYVSRVTPKKNLHFLLERLRDRPCPCTGHRRCS
ncbi:MAG: hypothetical protein R2712_27310 [Vicinamibacterales bacterium]